LVAGGVSVNTYFGFCTEALRQTGIEIHFGADGPQDGTWQDVQERLIAANVQECEKFDCLVVDEGQDFEPEWFEILKLFLTEDATVLWLDDPQQNLLGKAPVPLPGFVCYRESANFRTPQSIG